MIDQQHSAPQPSSRQPLATSPSAAPDLPPAPERSRADARPGDLPGWLSAALLIVVVLVGAYFRFTGLNWDDTQHLHPDERFMANVAGAIRPVGNLFAYFDTANSTLNPFAHGSYTYGMLPLFLARYVAEAVKKTEYGELVLVGRVLSGIFDLAVVPMLFFLGARLYSRRVGLLAAGLYAAAVLPIQLSHYFTVDSFASIFIVVAFFVAAPVMDKGQRRHYAVFGLATGLAMACKINTAPLAGIIILAGGVRLIKGWRAAEDRKTLLKEVLIGWLIAGGLAAVFFRAFQPYAFNGPGILGLSLNQRWLDIMREVTEQVAGKSEWPPNHHWTNRSQLTFAWIQNAGWGLGLPLGIMATTGWAWAARRVWSEATFEPDSKREWQGHLLLIVWVGAYFAWQNAQFWRYMRYFMPIYPLAILLAAWTLVEFFDRVRARHTRTVRQFRQTTLLRVLAAFAIVAVTLSTYGYAFAFTRIYTRPHTRVAASWWMLENIPGPLNLHLITAADGAQKTQPLSVPYDLVLKPGEPWRTPFEPTEPGSLSEITSHQLYAPDTTIEITLTRDRKGNDVVVAGRTVIPASPDTEPRPATVLLAPLTLSADQPYYVHYTVRSGAAMQAGDLSLNNGSETALALEGQITAPDTDEVGGVIEFTPNEDVAIDRLNLGAVQLTHLAASSTVKLILSRDSEGRDKLAESEITINLAETASTRTFSFSPVKIETGQQYFVSLEVMAGAPLRPAGTILAMETSWDDSLPLRVGGFDPLGGIYRLTNLELFEPDTAAKRDRMLEVLARSDYLVISSNRAYDAMPRLPLRYPMTLKYYQALFGCEEELIIHCAYPAQEGLKGPLGYELIAVFESNPTIGDFEFSDQAAEEAFTVYDHPKVMIFKRTADYSPEYAAEVLNSVDLTEVLDQGPAHYTAMPTALKLPPDRLAAQTNGGTWSDLFDPYGLLNWYQPLGAVAWYLLLLVMGWLAWPVAFVILRGLPDRGYPLAKFIGLLIVTWLAWFAGSYKLLMFTRATLWFIVVLLTCLGGLVALRNWAALSNFTRSRRNYILLVEAFTLALFLFFLWIRWLNPDLWHPWLGGEKPADYSFFQSVIRSVYFPPYDPWLAGHYVNYYYYGFVLAAVPTKLLGIVPAIAYNLALPTLFAFAGIGAFCAAYNLAAKPEEESQAIPTHNGGESHAHVRNAATPEAALTYSNENRSANLLGMLRDAVIANRAVVAGLAATVMMVLLGNFYQIRQLWRYLPEAADPPAPYSENVIENTFNALGGGWRVLTGQADLPGEKGRWYFGPSRAILHDGPDTPITEFPLFSFLYADLHPHLVSMSLMLAALAWMMSLAFSAQETGENADAPPGVGHRWAMFEAALFWFVGGLIVGALQPTHTWDYPAFMLLGVFTIVASVWLKERTISRPVVQQMAGGVALFVGFVVILYYPYRQWFATDFSSIEFWKFTRTPLTDYFTVHGLFLFIIVTWLIRESRSWRKAIPTDYLLRTPLGELLPRIRTPLLIAGVAIVALFAVTLLMWVNDYRSVWLALPLLIWAVALFFQRGQSLPRRAWLVIVATGISATLLVEFVTLRGDLGRSNTVFRFYVEAWLFFSVAAGAALAWLLPSMLREWPRRPRTAWLSGVAILVAAAGAYTVTGTWAKATDRWPGIETPPHTLDGNAYMLGSAQSSLDTSESQTAAYDDDGALYILEYDYAAIRWLQDNVQGTPAIVEGTSPLYRWGSRIAINTGLPAVVGWDYHLKQHDSILPGSVVDNRVRDVRKFYDTTDPEEAMAFLKRYNVQYIVIGGLERKYYQADGLAKFSAMVESGQIELVYPVATDKHPEATHIYQVASGEGE